MLRVIGGRFRGRRLLSVPGESTRPPLSRVRAAVANILADYVDGARVLDLFTGTGSYSIELLSRGASFATMIDIDGRAVDIAKKNVDSLGIADRVRVIRGDAISVARSLESVDHPYRIILVAPPYFSGLDLRAMEALRTSRLVDLSGIVVLQQHKKEAFSESYGSLRLKRTYLYGETRISTYLPSIDRPPVRA